MFPLVPTQEKDHCTMTAPDTMLSSHALISEKVNFVHMVLPAVAAVFRPLTSGSFAVRARRQFTANHDGVMPPLIHMIMSDEM